MQVLHRRDPQADADLAVGQGVVDGPDQVVHFALELAHECRGDPLGAGPHVDGIRPHVEAAGLRLAHPPIHGHERNPLTVDGDLDLLGPKGPPEDFALRVRIRLDVEDVLAVGGEVMDHGHPATGSERCPLDPIFLRGGPRDPIPGRLGLGLRVTQGDPADVAGRPQVALHHRGRRRLDVGDIVEVGALGVERKEGGHVDFESQEGANGARVLRPGETLEGSRPRIGVGESDRVDTSLQIPGQDHEGITRRPLPPLRRHHARPELLNHLLGGLGHLGGLLDLEVDQGQVSGEPGRVVAARAVLLDHVGQRFGRDVRVDFVDRRGDGRFGDDHRGGCRDGGPRGSPRGRRQKLLRRDLGIRRLPDEYEQDANRYQRGVQCSHSCLTRYHIR